MTDHLGHGDVSPQTVLSCPMGRNDADAATVRDYLVALVREVWKQGEGFNGKRPFGNSSWEYEVYTALGKAALIEATFDEYGYVEDMDTAAADALVLAAIDQLVGGPFVARAGEHADD